MTDPSLPFFVYGTLKPRELAHQHIADHVERAETAVLARYSIAIRDGLPGLVPSSAEIVRGYLLYPYEGQTESLAVAMATYEPANLYSVQEVDVVVGGDNVRAHTHVFRKDKRGHVEMWPEPEWFLRDDPLLRHGLPYLRRAVIDHIEAGPILDVSDFPTFWTRYLPLLGHYLAMCGILERYVALAFAEATPSRGIARLDRSSEGLRAAAEASRPSEFVVYRADDLDAVKWQPGTQWAYWYQVRSNAVHRGKSAFRDSALVSSSASGLSQALVALLGFTVDGLERRWAADSRDAGLEWVGRPASMEGGDGASSQDDR